MVRNNPEDAPVAKATPDDLGETATSPMLAIAAKVLVRSHDQPLSRDRKIPSFNTDMYRI